MVDPNDELYNLNTNDIQYFEFNITGQIFKDDVIADIIDFDSLQETEELVQDNPDG